MKSSRHRDIGLKGPFNHMVAALNWPLLIVVASIWVSALAVIYSKHYARVWHAKSEQLQQRRQALHSEWSQLLVDVGSWANKSHLEQLAKQQNLIFPERTEILVVSSVDPIP
jgi:cell division protein FtsL